MVVFTNNSNTFTVNSSNDSIVAYLKNNRVELAKVAITASTSTKEVFVNFSPAWPDYIFVEPSLNSIFYTLSSKALITAKLVKQVGNVSIGQMVIFSDSTPNNKSIGTFLNTIKSNDLGEATSTYWIQDTTYKGPVYIRASVNAQNSIIVGRNRLIIQ